MRDSDPRSVFLRPMTRNHCRRCVGAFHQYPQSPLCLPSKPSRPQRPPPTQPSPPQAATARGRDPLPPDLRPPRAHLAVPGPQTGVAGAWDWVGRREGAEPDPREPRPRVRRLPAADTPLPRFPSLRFCTFHSSLSSFRPSPDRLPHRCRKTPTPHNNQFFDMLLQGRLFSPLFFTPKTQDPTKRGTHGIW